MYESGQHSKRTLKKVKKDKRLPPIIPPDPKSCQFYPHCVFLQSGYYWLLHVVWFSFVSPCPFMKFWLQPRSATSRFLLHDFSGVHALLKVISAACTLFLWSTLYLLNIDKSSSFFKIHCSCYLWVFVDALTSPHITQDEFRCLLFLVPWDTCMLLSPH